MAAAFNASNISVAVAKGLNQNQTNEGLDLNERGPRGGGGPRGDNPGGDRPGGDGPGGGGPDGGGPGGGGPGGGQSPQGDVNTQLRELIEQRNLDVDPTIGRDLSNVNDIMAQLGKSLFFAKNLGGQNDSSCATCHHPTLGGGDNLSLPVGVDAVNSDYDSGWPVLFNQAYPDGEINFDRIAHAIGEYERSMTFINNPWTAYLRGDDAALTDQQKAGAILFFSPRNQGGAGCAGCHNGPTFSDGRHHLTAFPQIGPGSGDDSGFGANDDFGREHVNGNQRDRYHFRTASLLNIAVTAPYGHSGGYETLEQVVRHYRNPRGEVNRLFGVQGGEPYAANEVPLCNSAQVAGLTDKNAMACDEVYPAADANSTAALDRLQAARNDEVDARAPLNRNARINNAQVQQLVAFLQALTDPCVTDRDCLAPWIIDQNNTATYPDNNPLIATDEQGDTL